MDGQTVEGWTLGIGRVPDFLVAEFLKVLWYQFRNSGVEAVDAGAFLVFGEISQPNLPEFDGIGAGQGGFHVGQDLLGPSGGVLGPFQHNPVGFGAVKVHIREGEEEEIIVGTAIVYRSGIYVDVQGIVPAGKYSGERAVGGEKGADAHNADFLSCIS